MRKWRLPDVPAEDEWTVKYQVVIPKAYRREILSIAHETSLAGHLGVNKTYQKILNHFYWPNLKKDVAEFCKSCHTCQIVANLIRQYQKLHFSQSQPLKNRSAE